MGSEFFPEKIERYVPFIMNEDELKIYEDFENIMDYISKKMLLIAIIILIVIIIYLINRKQ